MGRRWAVATGLLAIAVAAAGVVPPSSPFGLCLAGRPPTSAAALGGAWSLAPAPLVPLLPLAPAFRRADLDRSVLALGWLALAVALISPLCRLAATLASL